MTNCTRVLMFILLISFMANSAFSANLLLKKDASHINFISIKNENIAEIHAFDDFSGTLSSDGKLQLTINLVSVNTQIPIRNERMQKMLFDISNFAVATFVANIDKSLINMPVGTSKNSNINGLMTIKDITVPISFFVNITSLKDGKVSATTINPTIVNAKEFDLEDGIDALQKIAKLKIISKSVPLTFNVVFQ